MGKTQKTKNRNSMKIIKILTIALLIILVSMVSFMGIYKQNKNKMESTVKDYSYSMAINGARTITLKANTETTEVVKDKDGNTVKDATDEQIQQNGYTKEEVKNNSDEVLTAENYKKSKDIIEERLKKSGAEEYNINVNEATGEITIEIPENDKTDSIIGNLNTPGKFEIIDTDSKEVLLDNNNIKSSSVLYNSTSKGTGIYLEISFNKQGKDKLEEISTTYATVNNTTNNTTETNTANNVAEENTDATNETTDTTTENSSESTNTTTQKKITMKIDDSEIMSTSFDEPITTGKIQLSVGSSTTDTRKVQDYATQAQNVATVLDSGNLPVKYDINKNEYVISNITNDKLQKAEIAIAIVALVGIIILIIKHKLNGLLAGIAYIGFTALYMLAVRYTNVVISLESICGIIITLVLNYIFAVMLLNKIKKMQENKKENPIGKAIKETYKEFFIKIIPICIMVITFCFIKWIPISSFGMITFWGIVILAIYNAIVTQALLRIKAEN